MRKIELIIAATSNTNSKRDDNKILDKDILTIGTEVDFKDDELPF